MSPLISVIIPTYNCLDYFRETVIPMTKMDPAIIETIIINDGATDGTEEFLKGIADQYPHFKIIHQKNGGLSHARNTGMEVATGKYYFFCDGDDVIMEEPFMEMVKFIEKNDFDVIVCNFLNQNPDLETTKVYYNRSKLGLMTGPDFLKHYLKSHEYGSESYQYFFKREYFGNDRFYVGLVHEDDQLYPNILFRAKSIYVTDKVIYFRKFRAGSIIRTADSMPRRNIKDNMIIVDTFKKNLLQYNSTKDARRVFKTFEVRTWLSVMDYLKMKPSENRVGVLEKRPNPWSVLLDPDIIFYWRMKYFRRYMRFK